jgi:3-hydroxypropanoate dehydrogenase
MTDSAGAASTIELDRLDDNARASLFTEARTAYSFADLPVTDDELRSIWNLAKWPPTSANFQTMRVLYVQSAEGREKLGSFMNDNNRQKTIAAPAVAVLAFDKRFHTNIPMTTPHMSSYVDVLEANEQARLDAARNNAWLQAGYFILAARAEGLATGPQGGFDAAAVDAEFFPDDDWSAFLVVNLGHPTEASYRDRLPRLDNDLVVRWA